MIKVKITDPKKSKAIPVTQTSEQRIKWESSGPAESFELEVLGSSGNPSLQFTLEGQRTRQKLTTLPPGRYTIRLRAIHRSGEISQPGEWEETFFDVIQTEAGQLSPTDVSAKLIPHTKPPQLLIQWKKSPAPQYQVRITSDGEEATILRSSKSKIKVPAPKSGTSNISICALDSNLRVRGCAPDVKFP